jgi:hypothetical protein
MSPAHRLAISNDREVSPTEPTPLCLFKSTSPARLGASTGATPVGTYYISGSLSIDANATRKRTVSWAIFERLP